MEWMIIWLYMCICFYMFVYSEMIEETGGCQKLIWGIYRLKIFPPATIWGSRVEIFNNSLSYDAMFRVSSYKAL